jgi:hypothetical protein
VRVDEAENVVVSIRVQAVPWIPVDEVVLYGNGEELWRAETIADAVVRVDEDVDLGTLGTDTWLVVEAGTPWPAEGEDPPTAPEPLAFVAPEVVPHAFTNPIFVTADGDAVFTPPGL